MERVISALIGILLGVLGAGAYYFVRRSIEPRITNHLRFYFGKISLTILLGGSALAVRATLVSLSISDHDSNVMGIGFNTLSWLACVCLVGRDSK